MSILLPNSVNYAEGHPSLPEGVVATQITLSPANGSTFSAGGSVIQFDYLNRGFIDPQSIFLRYKYAMTTTALGAEIIGTPVYTPFVRMETLIGSSVVESQNQYNQNCNMLVNLSTDVASKYGLQSAYNYGDSNTPATPAMSAMDGHTCINNETGFMSGMLPGLLSNCEKLIPAFAMPQIRTQLTLDSIQNIFTSGATSIVPSVFTLSNVELVYTMIDMGQQVESMVRSLGTFYIKSQSLVNSSVTLANATSGSISLVFNQRLASVKSAFILFTGTNVASVNKWGDAYDPTQNSGEISINVGGISYPQRPLSTITNKAGILQYLRSATGSIYDKNNSLSINSVEWNRTGITVPTTLTEPAKFIVGVNLEKIHGGALLTGISTQNSAITVLVSTTTATAQAHTVNLILSYDALVEINVDSRQVSVKM